MSDESQSMTYDQALIERQSRRIGQMATQIESMIIQLEQAQIHLQRLGYNLDGTPLMDVEAEPVQTGNGEWNLPLEKTDAGLSS